MKPPAPVTSTRLTLCMLYPGRGSRCGHLHQRIHHIARKSLDAPALEFRRNQERVRSVDVAPGVVFGHALQEALEFGERLKLADVDERRRWHVLRDVGRT